MQENIRADEEARRVLLLDVSVEVEVRMNERGVGDDGEPGLADGSEPQQGFHWQPGQDLPDDLVEQLRRFIPLPLPLPCLIDTHGAHRYMHAARKVARALDYIFDRDGQWIISERIRSGIGLFS